MSVLFNAIIAVLGQDIPLIMITVSIPCFAIALFCCIFHSGGEYNG